jgi:hypothetical protein
MLRALAREQPLLAVMQYVTSLTDHATLLPSSQEQELSVIQTRPLHVKTLLTVMALYVVEQIVRLVLLWEQWMNVLPLTSLLPVTSARNVLRCVVPMNQLMPPLKNPLMTPMFA